MINFHKTKIGGVGIERDVMDNYASILNCSFMSIPFKVPRYANRGKPKRKNLLEGGGGKSKE